MLSFQEKVYREVKKIPKGETATYKEVAVLAGRPRAWRAVGNILNKNFNPKIPCHRVIRSDGKLGGYNRGVSKKKLLLRLEQTKIINHFPKLMKAFYPPAGGFHRTARSPLGE